MIYTGQCQYYNQIIIQKSEFENTYQFYVYILLAKFFLKQNITLHFTNLILYMVIHLNARIIISLPCNNTCNHHQHTVAWQAFSDNVIKPNISSYLAVTNNICAFSHKIIDQSEERQRICLSWYILTQQIINVYSYLPFITSFHIISSSPFLELKQS